MNGLSQPSLRANRTYPSCQRPFHAACGNLAVHGATGDVRWEHLHALSCRQICEKCCRAACRGGIRAMWGPLQDVKGPFMHRLRL